MSAIESTRSSQGSTKMQQIERYGVIALVFLLVTIVAVSFWGDSKSPGFWSRLTGKKDAKQDQIARTEAEEALNRQHLLDGQPPITPPTSPVPPADGPTLVDGNMQTTSDLPPVPTDTTLGMAGPTAPGTQPNPFVPGAPPPAATPIPIEPAPPAMVSYVVQKGDSLASIARKRLGAESRWPEIQAANAGLEPRSLKVGSTIVLPADAKTVVATETKKSAPAPKSRAAQSDPRKSETKKSPTVASKTAGGSYKIKKGDGLRSIARTQLGDESRWKEIQALNPGIEPTRLKVGDTIKLPGTRERAGAGEPALASAKHSSANDDKPQVR
jgi:nucleoid-associated protein YgaU